LVTRDMGAAALSRWVMGTRKRWPSGATSKRVPTDEVLRTTNRGCGMPDSNWVPLILNSTGHGHPRNCLEHLNCGWATLLLG
jgi:hypothetical protein